MAWWYNKMADLPETERTRGRAAIRSWAHGLRGDRASLLSGNPGTMSDNDTGVLWFCQGNLSRGSSSLLTGTNTNQFGINIVFLLYFYQEMLLKINFRPYVRHILVTIKNSLATFHTKQKEKRWQARKKKLTVIYSILVFP